MRLVLFAFLSFMAMDSFAKSTCGNLFDNHRAQNDLVLDVFIENKTDIKTATTLNQAFKTAKKLNIKTSKEFRKLPQNQQLEFLNKAIAEVSKMPPIVLAIIAQAGFGLDLVLNSITSHRNFKFLTGSKISKWGDERTWDDVPGAGATLSANRTVIAINRLSEGHGSLNLILHEHAHTFDLAISHLVKTNGQLKVNPPQLFSAVDPIFKKIWKKTLWEGSYFKINPEEAFAESFAYYFDSPHSRAELKNQYPLVYDYFRNRFGD